MNKVILIGRLTRDPELKYIPAGDAVASFKRCADAIRALRETPAEGQLSIFDAMEVTS